MGAFLYGFLKKYSKSYLNFAFILKILQQCDIFITYDMWYIYNILEGADKDENIEEFKDNSLYL